MRPLSGVLPKPLLPLWGRPALFRALDLLRAWGVREALINLHHGADRIFDAAPRYAAAGLRLAFSFEPEILGTGGALVRARWFIENGGPFWLFNADVAAALDPTPLLRAISPPDTLAALWVHPDLGPRTVEVREGRVVSFRSPRPGAPGTRTFCGLHLLRPEILRYLPREESFFSIIEAYEAALSDGRKIAAIALENAGWADIGTPENYLEAHGAIRVAAREGAPFGRLYDAAAEFRARRAARGAGAQTRGFVAAGAGVRWGARAVIEDSVLLDGARVAAGARIRSAIVGPGATAFDGMERLIVRATDALTAAEQTALRRLGWPLERASAEAPAPRGSDRSFLRLAAPRRRAMLIRYGAGRPENARYAGHARFLRALGLPVPAVLAEDSEARFAVFEDLGRHTLEDDLRGAMPARFRRLYTAVVEAVADWHERAGPAARAAGLAMEPAFGPEVYGYERRLFLERFLAEFLGCDRLLIARVERELRGIAQKLEAAAPTLLHRDLQSSNILLLRGRPHFIDFQGMRFGPAAYDLASLLCDPYVAMPDGARDEMLRLYAARRPAAADAIALFWPAAAQRLSQALGAYARLASTPAGRRFLKHVPVALARLREAIERSGLSLPALRSAVAAAERREGGSPTDSPRALGGRREEPTAP